MINIYELIQAVAQTWQNQPEVVALVGNDPNNIIPFLEEYPQSPDLDFSIKSMPNPGVLIAYGGSDPKDLETGAVRFAHKIEASVKLSGPTGVNGTLTYYGFVQATVDSIHPIEGVPLIDHQYHPRCYSQLRPPTVERQKDASGMDYFKITMEFVEQ